MGKNWEGKRLQKALKETLSKGDFNVWVFSVVTFSILWLTVARGEVCKRLTFAGEGIKYSWTYAHGPTMSVLLSRWEGEAFNVHMLKLCWCSK